MKQRWKQFKNKIKNRNTIDNTIDNDIDNDIVGDSIDTPEPVSHTVLDETIERLKLCHSRRHLVVDDINTNRSTLKYYLTKKNIRVTEATNGAEAVEIVTRNDVDYFDVIWMDIKMPFMDGVGATNLIRKRGYKNAIIMITGHIDRNTLLKCKLEGADKILSKPVIKEQLYDMDIFSIYHLFDEDI